MLAGDALSNPFGVPDFKFTRRDFLKINGATTLALSLDSLGFLGGTAHATSKVFQKWEYGGWEALHRDEWTWDSVTNHDAVARLYRERRDDDPADAPGPYKGIWIGYLKVV